MGRRRFLHSQLRNKQVPCYSCSYPENTIPPVKKSKQHEKWWKNQTRSRGKHKVCLMLAPSNKGISPKVFEKKWVKSFNLTTQIAQREATKQPPRWVGTQGGSAKKLGKDRLRAWFLSLKNMFRHSKLVQPLGHLNSVSGCYEKNLNCCFHSWEKRLFS